MTMAMISPSVREVSPTEQLCRSSRFDPPRFRLVAEEFHTERLLLVFFSTKDFIQQKMVIGEPPGGPRGRGAPQGGAPHPRGQGVGPLVFIFGEDFSLFIIRYSVEFRTFGVVQNRSLIFAPFPAQNSSCRHSPSLCKPCKIRENSHKYCDII